MADHCTECGAPMVCLTERLEVELADLRAVVDLAVAQVRERLASHDIAEAIDWTAESRKISYAELARRRQPFEGRA